MREFGDLLSAWNSFYVMVGSAAAALTGLMFVVITLVRDEDGTASEAGVSTFTTPTVVHFSGALFVSALMSAPFKSGLPIAIVLGFAGAFGLVQTVRVGLRTARLEQYRPDAEDWIWNVGLPLVAYGSLALGALTITEVTPLGFYAPAAAVALLLFIGIHNAWDVVTFLAMGKNDRPPDPVSSSSVAKESDAPASQPPR